MRSRAVKRGVAGGRVAAKSEPGLAFAVATRVPGGLRKGRSVVSFATGAPARWHRASVRD